VADLAVSLDKYFSVDTTREVDQGTVGNYGEVAERSKASKPAPDSIAQLRLAPPDIFKIIEL